MASKAKGTIDIVVKGDRFKSTINDFVSTLTKLESAGKQSGTALKNLGGAAQGAVSRINTLQSTTSRASASLFKNTQGMSNLANATVQMAQKSQGAVLPMDKLNTAINNTNRSAVQLGSQGAQGVNKFSNAATQAGGASQRMSQGMNQATASQSKFNAGTIGTAASIGTMGAGLVSLEASMSNLAKAEQKVDKAEQGLQKTRDLLQTNSVSLQRAELRLVKMIESGNKSREELAAAEANVELYRQKIATATDELTIKEQDLNIALMDQADTHKMMASSIATTLLGTLSAAASMVQAKTMSTLKDTAATGANTSASKSNALANIANSRALKKLGFDLSGAKTHFNAASVSMKSFGFSAHGARAGLSAVSSGFKGLYAAMGPVGLAIIAATTIWSLWESNALGFRDAIHWVIDELQKLMGHLNKILPIFGWIDDGLKSMGVNVGENIDKWQEMDKQIYQTDGTLQDVDTTIQHVDDTVNTMGDDVGSATEVLESFETQADDTGGALDEMTTDLDESTAAVNTHTTAISADMAMLRKHAQATGEHSATMLDSHIQSFSDSVNSMLTHEQQLRANLASIQDYAKGYKESMDKGIEVNAQYVAKHEEEFAELIAATAAMGHDVGDTLNRLGLDHVDLAGTVAQSMTEAGGAMDGFANTAGTALTRFQTSAQQTSATVAQLTHMIVELSKKKSSSLNDLKDITDAANMTKAQIDKVIHAYNQMKQNEFLNEMGMPNMGQFNTDDWKPGDPIQSTYSMGYGESGFLNKETGQIDYAKLQQIGDLSAENLARIKAASREYYGKQADEFLMQLGLSTSTSQHSADDKEDVRTVRELVQTNAYANPNHPTQGVDYGGGGDYTTATGGNTPSNDGPAYSGPGQKGQSRAARAKVELAALDRGMKYLKILGNTATIPPGGELYKSNMTGWERNIIEHYNKIMAFLKKGGIDKIEPMSGDPITTKSRLSYGGFTPFRYWTDAAIKQGDIVRGLIAEAAASVSAGFFGGDKFKELSELIKDVPNYKPDFKPKNYSRSMEGTKQAQDDRKRRLAAYQQRIQNAKDMIQKLNEALGTNYTYETFFPNTTIQSSGGGQDYSVFGTGDETTEMNWLVDKMIEISEQKAEEKRIQEINEALERQLDAVKEKERQEREAERIEQERIRQQENYQMEMTAYNQDMALYNMIKRMFPEQTPAWTPTKPAMQTADPRMGFYNWLSARGFSNADSAGVDAALYNDPSIFQNAYVRGEYGTHAEFSTQYHQMIEVHQK